MRKLLTMMAAVASALGLYASDSGALSGTSFEGLAAGPYSITAKGSASGGELGEGFIDGTTTYWVTNETATLEIVGERSSVATRPEAFDSYNQESYLSVKTTLGNPVSRYVNSDRSTAVSMSGGLYFDSLVKFTAFDSDPTIELGNDGKLAIWLKESVDEDDKPTATNLVITAGYVDGNGTATTTNYVSSIINGQDLLNDGGWHRVTVRMIDSIFTSGSTPGFVIAIDEHRVVNGETKFVVPDGNSLTAVAAAFDDEGSLFPSALQSGDKMLVSAVSFDGQGCVDDVVFTRTQPTCVKDPDIFTITIGENVASAKYTLNGSESPITITNETGYGTVSVRVPYASGTYFTISDVILAEGYMEDDPELKGGMTENSGEYSPLANSELVIKAKSLGAYVNGVPYETLADAITYVNDTSKCPAGSGTYTITMAENASGNVDITNAGITNILDLAGNTFTGTATDAAAIFVTEGALIITDSSQGKTGVVQSAVDDGALIDAVGFELGTVTIQYGKFNGKVSATEISGGSFLATYNEQEVNAKVDLDTMIVDGYEATLSGDYYVLTEASNYVAEIDGTGYETFAAAFAAAADGDTITLLSNVTEARFSIAADRFATLGLTIDLGGYTYTFTSGNAKDAIELLKGNKLTIENGTIAAEAGSTYRDAIRDYNSDLTLTSVTIDGANFPATDGDKLACLICVEGGDVDILGTTSIINVKSAAYAIKMGNHASDTYVMGTTTVNTTGNIMGNVLIAGGVYDEVAVGSASTINYYYGKNVHSTWEDGVSSTIFAARTGTLPTAAGTQDNVSGQLFKQFTGAFTASNEFTLLANYAGDVTFTMDTRITANGYELTGTLSAPAGYEVRAIEGVYQAARPIFTITFEAGENATVTPATTNYTIDSGTIVLPTPTLNGGAVGPTFDGWTNATITAAITQFTPQAGNLSDFTLYAKWTAGGPTYPDYIDTLDDTIKGQYNTWAAANNVTDGTGLEAFFLLNVAPGGLTPVLSSTTFSISGTTVTIDINHGNLNGYPYIKKASTLAGLKTATKESIDVVPADGNNANIDNGGRVTLTGESAAAQFYQIGVQSTPVAVPNNSND